MARNSFDFSELEEFAKKLENAESHVHECIENTNNEIALRLLSAVIKKTDEVEYASYVEFGHRTKERKDGTRGYVEPIVNQLFR